MLFFKKTEDATTTTYAIKSRMYFLTAFLAFFPMTIIRFVPRLGWVAIIVWIIFFILTITLFKENHTLWKLRKDAKAKNLLVDGTDWYWYVFFMTIKK